MTPPWTAPGARLHLPRDLHIAYVLGRMALATSLDTYPLWYGSPVTARLGFHRLVKLGILTMFPRAEATHPGWFTLARDAAPWVAEAMDCEETEFRVVSGIARANLLAVRARNRLWVSLVTSCRGTEGTRLALFRPEWELRRLRAGSRVVPDAMFVLQAGGDAEFAWFVELDAGTERLAVWNKKADEYAEALRSGALYGEASWNVLVLVPSERRARSVARVCAATPAASRVFLARQEAVEDGRALAPVLWSASDLASPSEVAELWTLLGTAAPVKALHQRGPSAADGGDEDVSGGASR